MVIVSAVLGDTPRGVREANSVHLFRLNIHLLPNGSCFLIRLQCLLLRRIQSLYQALLLLFHCRNLRGFGSAAGSLRWH
jgi:hypothetical protein